MSAAHNAAANPAAASAEISLRIGQRVVHGIHGGKRVTGVVRSLGIEDDRGLMVTILLDAPIVIPPYGEDDREILIHWQTAQAHEFAPFDERDELLAEMRTALVAMEHEFGRTYLAGSSHSVDLARAAIAKVNGDPR